MADYLRIGRVEIDLDYFKFITENTAILSPPLVPEIRLHLAYEALPIWQKTEDELQQIGLPPPFWAFAWAGGQALSRYILDNPDLVRGKRVVDIASGSGLVAIAAMKAGAQSVLAADIDKFSEAAMQVNAALNGVKLSITIQDLLLNPAPISDVILVGDLFYEKTVAEKCFAWLQKANAKTILIGDPGRSYLPKDKLIKIASYAVPVSRELEDAEIKQTSVWKIA